MWYFSTTDNWCAKLSASRDCLRLSWLVKTEAKKALSTTVFSVFFVTLAFFPIQHQGHFFPFFCCLSICVGFLLAPFMFFDRFNPTRTLAFLISFLHYWTQAPSQHYPQINCLCFFSLLEHFLFVFKWKILFIHPGLLLLLFDLPLIYLRAQILDLGGCQSSTSMTRPGTLLSAKQAYMRFFHTHYRRD